MLQVEHVSFSIKRKRIIEDITMEVRPGEFVGVIGPNGSGKTTLLKQIYKVQKPDEGSIRIHGENLLTMTNRQMAFKLAVVGQDGEGLFDFTVEEVVEMGRYCKKGLFESCDQADKTIVRQALAQTGMTGFEERSFLTLSGGERQRVLIARAFAQETELIILDEPTNHLDVGSQNQTLNLLRQSEKTVLTALHDLSLAARYCDRIYALHNGKVCAQGVPSEVITSRLINTLYHMEAEVFFRKGQLYLEYH